MLEYSVKVLPGKMTATVVNLLHDLVENQLIELTPTCPKGRPSDKQTHKLVDISDFASFLSNEEN